MSTANQFFSLKERDDFDRQGFVITRGLYSGEEIRNLSDWIDEMAARPPEKRKQQDIQPCWDDYAPYFISVLVTVDPSALENGCLELAAGHHRRGWIGERWKPLVGSQLEGMEFLPSGTLFCRQAEELSSRL